MKLTQPQYETLISRRPLNLFMAGQGAGKTHVGGMLSLNYISNFPMVRGLICANTYNQLNQSTMLRVREVWKEMGMSEYSERNKKGSYVVGVKPPRHFDVSRHNFERYNNIISFDSGAVMFTASLDNYKAIEGMEIGWAILDETKDTREEAVKEVITGRLRQQGIYFDNKGQYSHDKSAWPFNPLYILTSPAKEPWINDWFGLTEHEPEINRELFSRKGFIKIEKNTRCIVIASTYTNEANLPDNYISNRKSQLPDYLQDMLIYGSPFAKSGGEHYPAFDRMKHVRECAYDPELPLHVSLDENVRPYMPCGVWQAKDKRVWKIAEYDMPHPDSKLQSVCQAISTTYKGHGAGMFIYGDRTSKKEDAKLPEGTDFYTLARQYLRAFRPVLRLPSANPPVVARCNFMNAIMEQGIYGIELSIGDECPNTIADYTYLKQASDGTKLKQKVRDKQSGASYEKYGHDSDLDEYFICQYFRDEFRRFQRGTDGSDQAMHRVIDKVEDGRRY